MSQTLYLAADGGGSKLQTVLYDQDFRILRTGRVAGVNTLFKPAEVVKANIEAMLAELLTGIEGDIAFADICMVGAGDVMKEALNRCGRVQNVTFRGESVIGLAASLKTSGVVALSGTGSDAFFIKDGVSKLAVGGWGPLLGDEGSGYDIGLRTLKAAIYAYDGRGEPSMLLDLVMENWKLTALWGIVGHLAGNPDARHEVASAAKLCSKAAHAGDKVGLRIYEHAALDLSVTARTVIDAHRSEWDGTVVIMGGAWKGHPRMFEVFKREIELLYPEAHVTRSLYDPVVGCAVLRFLDEGWSMEEIRQGLDMNFRQFLYDSEREQQ